MKCFGFACFIFAIFTIYGTEQQKSPRIVPINPTEEPDDVQIRFAYPLKDGVEVQNPVTVQLRIEGYPLGYITDLPRAREIRNSRKGQCLRLIVDGKFPIDIDQAIDDISETEEIDLDQTIRKKLPYNLSEGPHVLRAFLVRSFQESLKRPFAATVFFLKKKTGSVPNLLNPYLTYNQPEGEYPYQKPILLDFHLTNTQLSSDGYKVRVIIDNDCETTLVKWVPYLLYDLERGSHTIKLELLNGRNQVIKPLFNDLERTFIIK